MRNQETLSDLGDQQLKQVKSQADSDFNLFNEILGFDISPQDAPGRRDALIKKVVDAYQKTFNALHPIIAYGMTRAVDFQTMENEARAMIQSVQDQANSITRELEGNKEQAETILDEIRNVAAEQGVSQKAYYFKEESESHSAQAGEWQNRMIGFIVLLALYAVGSLFIHKIPFLTPGNAYEAVQLTTGKVLVFAVLAYLVVISARNFLSHKHNSIINKHRQNALMTFTALVEAAKEEDHSDIVLLHAAQCIFAPQETGYAKQTSGASGLSSSIELMRAASSKSE